MNINTNKELWRKYPRNSKIEVSTYGRVRKYTPYLADFTYFTPRFRTDTRTYVVSVGNNRSLALKHVVWETWKGEIPKGFEVYTKNESSTMCELSNLELRKKTVKTCNRKRKVVNLTTKEVYKSISQAAAKQFCSYHTMFKYLHKMKKVHCIKDDLMFYDEYLKKKNKNKIACRKRGRKPKKIFDCDTKTIYASINDCAKAKKMSTTAVWLACRGYTKNHNLKYYEEIKR